MKKLLFVMPALYGGGAEKSLVNLLNLLDYSRYEVDLLLFRQEGLFLSQVPEEVRILPIPSSLKYSYASPDKNMFRSLEAIKAAIIRIIGTGLTNLRYKKVDNLTINKQMRWKSFYSHTIKELPGHYDVALAYLHGETSYYVVDKVNADRKYLWIHNDYDKMKGDNSLLEKYFSRVDGVVSISDRCVDILKKEFPDIEDKFYMLPNLTSSDLLRKMADEYYPSEYTKNIPVLLSIGRLTNQKGFDYAVVAARILKKRGYKFIWYIVGEGELKEQLQEMIIEEDVDDYIKLLGIRENPYPYIKNCDVVVQPSRYEGKSVVLDEAKIIGKPIVVTNYSTVGDQIKDGREGIIVSMNPESVADGIEQMLTDAPLRESIQKYLCEHEYGNQDEVQKYIDLIDGKK